MFKALLNKLEERVTRISDEDYRPGRLSFEQLLVGGALLYRKGVEIRVRSYTHGRKHRKTLPCPVISIGNIVAGGAGKTPMAAFLAERLIRLGRRPAVVSRGYKGSLKGGPAVVGDGKQVFLDSKTAGDEPFMMAGLKRFPVVVGRDRYAAGKLALASLDVDVLILDDGFQHLRLHRDLDIVLMDCMRPLGNGRMLPAGRLREPPELCRNRISCLVMTRCPKEGGGGKRELAERLPDSFLDLPLFTSRHRSVLSGWTGEGPADLKALSGRRALLFSGIARNDAFRQSVRELGIKVVDHLEFKDHYRYKGADFSAVRKRAEELGVPLILTTEKDWVKVDRSFDFKRDVGVLGIAVDLDRKDGFDRMLAQAF